MRIRRVVSNSHLPVFFKYKKQPFLHINVEQCTEKKPKDLTREQRHSSESRRHSHTASGVCVTHCDVDTYFWLMR